MSEAAGQPDVLREAFASLGERARPSDGCPEPERVWDGARGELDPGELRDLVDHTASCAACAEAWRLAVEISDEVPQTVEPRQAAQAVAVSPRRRSAVAWWRIAAAAVVVFGAVGLFQMINRGEVPDTFRSGGGGRPVLSAAIPDGVALPRDAFELRWSLSAAAEGVRYHLRVTDDEFRELVSVRDLESPVYRVPASNLAGLESGDQVFWYVEAVDSLGTPIKETSFVAQVE